ncbi:MAG TPA: GNAT family protein [Acidobacteriota bacterium]|nr:GNAT family protein [Acidobacteriota bacterium]
MSYLRKLTGTKCYLATCSTDDAEVWAQWDNDLAVAVPLGDEAFTLYPVEKMKKILQEIIDKQMPVFNIVTCAADTLIGRCMLFQIDHVNRTAMLGMVIGAKDHWDKGYGLEATHLLLDYAFNLLNLNSIMLGVYAFNKRAIRCYEKAGFRIVGRRREARLIAGMTHDLVYMDLLASEFQSDMVGRIVKQ